MIPGSSRTEDMKERCAPALRSSSSSCSSDSFATLSSRRWRISSRWVTVGLKHFHTEPNSFSVSFWKSVGRVPDLVTHGFHPFASPSPLTRWQFRASPWHEMRYQHTRKCYSCYKETAMSHMSTTQPCFPADIPPRLKGVLEPQGTGARACRLHWFAAGFCIPGCCPGIAPAGCCMGIIGCCIPIICCCIPIMGCCIPIMGCCMPIIGCCIPIIGCCIPIIGCCIPIIGCCIPIIGCCIPIMGCCIPIMGCCIPIMGCCIPIPGIGCICIPAIA